MSKFEPLKNIQDRAELFSDENARLLAELMYTNLPGFTRLMEDFRQRRQGNSIHEVMTRRMARHFRSAKASRAGLGF